MGSNGLTMNIAVVGGGTRCKRLIEVIERHQFEEVNPKMVAVCDLRDEAPGITKARAMGLFVTHDYNDFFKRDDIDLIIELTGSMDIYNDILKKKKSSVRAISTPTAKLFWEISRLSTLQKKTHQELQETRAMYKTFINELIQEDVMVIAYDHRIIDINDNMLSKIGLPRDEVIGCLCYEITHHQKLPCSGDDHPCPLIQTLETQKPSQMTHVHLDKDKKEIYYSISTYPLIEEGDVIGAVEISRDITKEIDVQKAMMQQEKLASIGRLSAGVAHEVNNPLTTILTTAMLIQEDIEPENPIYQELDTITKEALRCRKIVTSLLDFARQTTPTKRECDINEIVQESLVLTRKQAAFTDLTSICELGKDLPRVYVDKGQIQQAIINLLINAIEATPPGGSLSITTSYDPRLQTVAITISDTGKGIDEDELIKIFDPFFTTKASGTGLGLAITHGIIEQHNGSITVDSQLGRGTSFKIRLPVASGKKDASG